jgi:chemotaxis protein MotD
MSAETLAAIRAKTPKAKPAEVATGRPAEKPADAAAQALEAGVTSLRKAAAGGAGADRGQSNAGSFGSRYAAQDGRRSDPSAAVKVSVVAQQAAPAPPAPTLSANAAAIISAAEQGWRAAAESPAQSALVLKGAQAMRSLKIQLHPAELGVVTASLKATGEHLSVELRVDNREAYHRLSADSDAIVKSLRALGYDIDRVSIHQPQAVSATAARPDAGSGTASFSRDASSFQPGNSGGNGERFGGQTDGRGYGDGTQRNDHAQPINQDRAGGGLYI